MAKKKNKKILTLLEEENLKIYGTKKVTPIPDYILEERISLLNKRLKKLMKKSFMKQDNNAINTAIAGIKFWKKLGGK